MMSETVLSAHPRRSWAGYGALLLMAAGFAVRLVYAVPDLHGGRFWDERYSLRNVRSLVVHGQVRPQNGYYPSLSYLPHAALIAGADGLHRATGIDALSMLDPEGPFGFSRSALLGARLVSVIAGTLTLGLVFLLGRRLSSPAVGLLAAGIVSASWTHLFVSAKFKPDVLTVLVFLIAFWWVLNALERPRAARFALAGLGVGLAASTKYLGASVAIPLVAGALFAAGRQPRTWARLALAGAVAIGSFVSLNPWLSLIVDDMSVTRSDYAAKAAAAGATHWSVLLEELAWIARDHRPAIAGFVILGCVGLAARAAGRIAGGLPRVAAVAVLAAILGHSAFYAVASRHFVSWNYVPVLPFTAFAAAWSLVGVAEWSVARFPRPARRRLRAALGLGTGAAVLVFPIAVAYAGSVPTTFEILRRTLSSRDEAPAWIVYAESVRSGVERVNAPPGLAWVEVESLRALEPTALGQADAVVFPAARLRGPAARSYSRLLDSGDWSLSRIEARWFRARGPSLVLAQNHWQPRGDVLHWPLEGNVGLYRLPLSEPLQAGETISLAIDVRRLPGRHFPGAVIVEGAGKAPLYQLRKARRAWMVTPRLSLDREVDAVVVSLEGLLEGVQPLELKLYRWARRPETASPGG